MINLQSVLTSFSRRQKAIHLVVVALLGLYLIAYFAEITWRLVPTKATQSSPQQSSLTRPSTAQPDRLNLNRLKQLNLFGRPVLSMPQQTDNSSVTDAPETKLNLLLSGVVASTEEKAGAAVIENRGIQQTYGIGEKIEATNATLKHVFNDRVIIKNGARDETLMLDGIDFDEANKNRQRASQDNNVTNKPVVTTPASNRRQLSQEALNASRQLRTQPASFTDFISVSPYQRDGQLQGYRLQPGKNPALFAEVGLKAGDVITEINGLNVTDPQQATEALGELRSADALQLTVIRNEEYLTLYLDLPKSSNDE